MSKSEIKEWIGYWTRAKRVNFDAVTSFERVNQVRSFCSCMRVGLFTDVTDLQIWLALCEMRNVDPSRYWVPNSAKPVAA